MYVYRTLLHMYMLWCSMCYFCAGIPGLIKPDMIKEGAAVIDIGESIIHVLEFCTLHL